MKIQHIDSNPRPNSYHGWDLYLVELDNGRKIEIKVGYSSFDGHNNSGPDNLDDGSYNNDFTEIVEEDSKRVFTEPKLPESVLKLIQAFQERAVKRIVTVREG